MPMLPKNGTGESGIGRSEENFTLYRTKISFNAGTVLVSY